MDGDTLLLRHIHPSFVQGDKVTSQAFRPTPKDGSKLSVYDGDQISPEPARQHYTQELGLASEGVMGITGEKCEAVNLPYVLTEVPFPEHAEIDFTGLGTNQIEKVSKKFRAWAESRGWLHRHASNE